VLVISDSTAFCFFFFSPVEGPTSLPAKSVEKLTWVWNRAGAGNEASLTSQQR